MMTTISGMVITSLLLGGGGFSLEEGQFNHVDRNRNQQIDQTEAASIHNLAQADVFNKYDKNGDGYILFYEFVEYLRLRSDEE